MVRRRFRASVLALLTSVFVLQTGVSFGAADGCPGAATVPTDGASRLQASKAVMCLVNRERASRDLRALRFSGRLSSAARAHSADMVARGYFAHDGPGGDTLATRMRRCGYSAMRPNFDVGETLAWGRQATARILVTALMNSAEHRRILVDGGARDVGIGLTLGAAAQGVTGPSSTLVIEVGA